MDKLNAQVVLQDEESRERAEEWARFLNVHVQPGPSAGQMTLFFSRTGVQLKDPEGRNLEIDFDSNTRDYHRQHRGKNELLAKALGLAKGIKSVLDISVGLAIDSVFLRRLGFEVQGLERSPLLYVLLEEAIRRTRDPQLKNYKLWHADASQFLSQQKSNMSFDALYFDPMYPTKKKSALPRQEMLVFRDMVGNDDDATLVLDQALEWPCQRVVVKRPLQAPALRPGVLHVYEGKLVRYDVYRRNR